MYLNVAEIESALANLHGAYPTRSELIALPHATHEGRPVHMLRVGAQTPSTADGVLVLGGLHAREWVPPDAIVSFAADLLEADSFGTGLTYGGVSFSAFQLRRAIQRLNFFCIACVNPDGRNHSQTLSANWRKNRRPAPGGGGASCVGVDLNRNFDFLWDHLAKFASDSGVNTSADPCHPDVYRGPSANSEPETRNVVWALDNYPRIRWLVDVHGAIPAVFHTWGSDQNQNSITSDSFLNPARDSVRGRENDGIGEYISNRDVAVESGLATAFQTAAESVRAQAYPAGPSFSLYPTSGASDDYAFSRHAVDPSKTKVFGYTVECGTQFQPVYSEAEQVMSEVSAGLVSFAITAHTVTDGLRVVLKTPSVVFNDVPVGETTARAVVWDCEGDQDLHFEVLAGPGAPFNLPFGGALVVPSPGYGHVEPGRLWITYSAGPTPTTLGGSVSVRCRETLEEWTIPLSGSTVPRRTAAVALVLDRSGSMQADAGDGRSRVEVLRESAQVFVDVLRPDTGIGIVQFDHDASTLMPVTAAGPEVFGAGRAQATASIAAHVPNPGGATSIGDGLAEGAALLDGIVGTFDTTSLIVLTDGQENSPKLIADVASRIDDRVFAIGLGEAEHINPAALSSITNSSGGYVSVTGSISADERFVLSKYYLQILAGVSNEEIVLDPQGRLRAGETESIPFSLVTSDSAFDVILLSPWPEVFTFELWSPTGQRLSAGNLGLDMQLVNGSSVRYFRSGLPVLTRDGQVGGAGMWTAHICLDKQRLAATLAEMKADKETAQALSRHGVPWSLEIHTETSLRLSTQVKQDGIRPGAQVALRASLHEFDIPLRSRSRVRAEIERLGGGLSEMVKLHRVGDGAFEGAFVQAVPGTYRARFVASGLTGRSERFTRERTLTFSAYEPSAPKDDRKVRPLAIAT